MVYVSITDHCMVNTLNTGPVSPTDVRISVRAKLRNVYQREYDNFTFKGPCIVNYMPIIVQQDATIYSLFLSVNRSTCFGWYLHPSSGAHLTVSTTSGISTTVTATCRKRDWTETSSHPVTFTTGFTVLLMSDAVDTVT